MRKFLLAAHGRMASGIKTSLDILFGNSDAVTVIDAYVDEKDVKKQVEEFFETVASGEQVIMLSDIYGGSVNQVLFQFLEKPDTFLISGMNLPLVIELVLGADAPITKEEIENLITKSRESIVLVQNEDSNDTGSDEFF